MIAVLARLLALLTGWVVAAAIAIVVGIFLSVPKLGVLLLAGAIWTCLLLLD
jgi:hypothetical protein